MLAVMMRKDQNGQRPNRQSFRLWADIMNNLLCLESTSARMVD